MRGRYSSPGVSYSFGPGPVSPAVKILIWTNIAVFLLQWLFPRVTLFLGLRPADVIEHLYVWQPLTYMFLHGGAFHIIFNMLALWMFGVELERMWGTPFFVRYYFVTGLGAAATTMTMAVLPIAIAERMYVALTIGASGAIYGLLLAYALYFPNRPIYMYFLFPIPVKYFVMIVGAIAFLSSVSDSGGGVAHWAHLGGLAVGYLYLRGGRLHPLSELKYRYFRWKMNRIRRRFDVYSGGRRTDDRDQRVH